MLEVADDTASPSEATPITTHVPSFRVLRPSQTSVESECLTIASADEDFTRLAKARWVWGISAGIVIKANFENKSRSVSQTSSLDILSVLFPIAIISPSKLTPCNYYLFLYINSI